jgi:predicted phosphoadenosine phosphosulfate sulfurtransferase
MCPPGRLSSADWNLTPRKNWNIEDLVTWMALNSYREYADVYDHFRKGYVFVEKSVKELTEKAAAMSMLALFEAVSPDSRARSM